MIDPFKFNQDDDVNDISLSITDEMKDLKISNINLFLDSIDKCNQCYKKIISDYEHDFHHPCRLCEGLCCKDCTEYNKKKKSCWVHQDACKNKYHFYICLRCMIRIKK